MLVLYVNVGAWRVEKQEAIMLGFHDTTRAIDERNEARRNFRTKSRIKTAIQQAAAFPSSP